jgi:hypothetical protein
MQRSTGRRLGILASCVAGLVSFGVGPGCGGKAAETWVGERAAVIRCTQAGRERMPPVLANVPVPQPPSGLFARALDPMSLDDLGIQRDQIACAILEAPDTAAIEAAAEQVLRLAEVYDRTSTEVVRAGGRCACDIAHVMGVRSLIAVCRRTPTQKGCADAEPSDELRAAIEPLRDAIEMTEPPLVHWRLVGRTDRPGWFADNLERLAETHPGGSTIYRRGQAVRSRGNHVLLLELLGQDDVVAVVSQDAGRAVLVAREMGKMLILDHFSHVETSADYEPLLPYLDNAHVESYVRRLAAPDQRRSLGLDPKAGYLAELDRARLEDVDAMIVAGSALTGIRYDPVAERRIEPAVLVDRVTLQAPFGTGGMALVARLELSEAGRAWAQGLGDEILSPTLDELGLTGEGPELVQPRNAALSFHLRGTSANDVLVHGLHRVGPLMRGIELDDPSSVQGRASAWRFELPVRDPVPEGDGSILRGLRDQIATRPYVAHADFDRDREVLRIELRPR